MTAQRSQHGDTVIIQATGKEFTEVLNNYIKELHARGHVVTKASRQCARCRQDFRVYKLWGTTDLCSIYSDFPEGDQCSFRQMNLHDNEEL